MWEGVYIVNKVIREGFLRGCGRETARWIFGRTAFWAEGTARGNAQRREQPGVLMGQRGSQHIWSGLSGGER